jgi:hypothetical protein
VPKLDEQKVISLDLWEKVPNPFRTLLQQSMERRDRRIEELEAELEPLRELAEMQKRHHAEQSHPYQVPFDKCIDPMCLKAREAEEAMKYG